MAGAMGAMLERDSSGMTGVLGEMRWAIIVQVIDNRKNLAGFGGAISAA